MDRSWGRLDGHEYMATQSCQIDSYSNSSNKPELMGHKQLHTSDTPNLVAEKSHSYNWW